ncbi:MAG TPA: peptidylprolyl isomerase, partial [Candidatus Woesearchaeota archaeon]|nr:peptidylprolyl isomerase [Candidatus Woesearchaeota archaeon]
MKFLIKKGDFVELDYTGRIKDDKVVFDTTLEQTAKDNNIHNPGFRYKPVIICVGEKHVVKGLDDALIGKKPGKYTIEVKAENAFGRKTAELLKLIPMRLFEKDNIKPFVGLEVNVDGTLGVVRSVSGGRVIVDF